MEATDTRSPMQIAETQYTKMRWALGINGLLAVVLGVMLLAWPGISVLALTIVGIASTVGAAWKGLRASTPMPHDMESWKGETPFEVEFRAARHRDAVWTMGLTLLTAVCGLAVGVVSYLRP